jgi:hypothetical protein
VLPFNLDRREGSNRFCISGSTINCFAGFDLSSVLRTRSLVRTPLYKRFSTKFSDKKALLRYEHMNSENSTMFTDNYTLHCYEAPVHDRRVGNHADFA